MATTLTEGQAVRAIAMAKHRAEGDEGECAMRELPEGTCNNDHLGLAQGIAHELYRARVQLVQH